MYSPFLTESDFGHDYQQGASKIVYSVQTVFWPCFGDHRGGKINFARTRRPAC